MACLVLGRLLAWTARSLACLRDLFAFWWSFCEHVCVELFIIAAAHRPRQLCEDWKSQESRPKETCVCWLCMWNFCSEFVLQELVEIGQCPHFGLSVLYSGIVCICVYLDFVFIEI